VAEVQSTAVAVAVAVDDCAGMEDDVKLLVPRN
jgi:hypothetical protein